jgi:hypothetical protein
MGGNVRATAMFREASTLPFCIHIIFLFHPSRITFRRSTIFFSCRISLCFELNPIFVSRRATSVSNYSGFYSLPGGFCFQLTPLFILCRATSVSNSLRLLFFVERLLFQTHSDFYSLPSNFCFQLLRVFFAAEHLVQINTRTFILPRTSF